MNLLHLYLKKFHSMMYKNIYHYIVLILINQLVLDRTDNPMKVDEIDSLSKDAELSQLVHTISTLDKNKRDLVNAYIQGLLK